ncbi:MAG: WD40/YVTN/BNR-like repeat-containing protein [Candidatus Aminicenantaceae bacterium]
MRRLAFFILVIFLISSFPASAEEEGNSKKKDLLSSETFSGLKFRSIGPAYTGGRIADFAVNPNNHKEYYVGVACGGVWKTVNAGTTFTPVFDKYGAYSIASIVIDPNNTNVVWIGTGEYNSQRAIGYGDGVYCSEDGGKSFKNMGLEKSEHIGRIRIDPRNSHVYVAAQGPLWGPGGDRGLYKTTDSGKTWKKILDISENTGITDIVMDPRNPDILYAASYQRRRRVFTLINGGPEGAVYKSTDAGETWTKLKSGLPEGDVGRIGLAISPANPDVVYAIIEAEGDTGGFFLSSNSGMTWKKMNKYVSRSPQYYNRIIADPKDVNKVYSLDVRTMVTEDGGKMWRSIGNRNRHVDDHALWINPDDTAHFIIGGDGGIYETFDNAGTWSFKANLPITQFYRVAVDNTLPFYYVYGGTQDNNSLGGPSRTTSSMGITNEDWFVTQGGDGFQSRIDPENPNIVYAQSQYGGIIRYDKKSGESISIKPQPPSGEAYRWNWNSPLIISPHSPTRLYFAANKLFRSDDRGDTWKAVSGDLTRQIDRNTLPVMGKIWSVDAVSKNRSTSLFGNIVSLTESPLVEGLIYVGTDDGLIQITEDGGANWQKIENVKDVPEMTYVSCLLASQHDANTVYASFDARKNNNLAPYLLKSTDRGKTWTSIKANLPERGTVFTIAEDHISPDLLFIGTEFTVFFTTDGGKKWVQLKAGLPTISVKDIAIHKGEDDLVLATFGRGFYILDDYSPLRIVKRETLEKEAILFPVKDALMFIQKRGKSSQGQSYFTAENPPVGATFTYYLKESIQTRKEKRKKEEKEAMKKGKPVEYPSFDELRAEDEEEAPYLLFTVSDAEGNVVRKLKASPKAGMNRITWDFCYPDTSPARESTDLFGRRGRGVLALPGNYQVTMGKCVDGVYTELAGPQSFNAVVFENTSLTAKDKKALVSFQKKVAELNRAVQGAVRATNDLTSRIGLIKEALLNTPAALPELMSQARAIERQTREVLRALTGDRTLSRRSENQPPSIQGRVSNIVYGFMRSTSAPTQTMKNQYKIAGEEFEPQLAKLKQLIEVDLKKLEKAMEEAGAPWTPGRIPDWKK